MTDEEVRHRAAGLLRLKGKVLPGPVWSQLRREYYVDDAKLNDRGFQRLLDRASQLLAEARRRKYRETRRLESQAFDPVPVLDPRESKRQEVFEAELRRLALEFGASTDADGTLVGRPLVRAFREDYLEGNTLSSPDAYQFIRSRALRFLPGREFRRLGVSAVRHRCSITTDRLRVYRHHVLGSGGRQELRRDPVREIHFQFVVHGKVVRTWVRINFRRSVFEDADVLEPLRFPGSLGRPACVRVFPGSVLSELRSVSTQLAERYLWDEAEATWFVLTGQAPRMSCFDVEQEGGFLGDHFQCRLSVSVNHWVSAKSVMQLYRRFQEHMLGRDNRQPRLDRLEFFEWVARRTQEGFTWRQMMEEWNRTHTRRRGKRTDVRNFQHDFDQLHRFLITGMPVATRRRASKKEGPRSERPRQGNTDGTTADLSDANRRGNSG